MGAPSWEFDSLTSTRSTPFALGVYVGNPDIASSANQATFDSNLSSFEDVLGTAPQYLTSFIDQQQSISNWVGNSYWAAESLAATPGGKALTPVIALPLSSEAAGSLSPDQSYQAFAAGSYDSVLKGIVSAWAGQGYTNLVFRPGWEFNLPGPTYAGSTPQSQADWVSAFQHVYTVLHQAAAADGVNVQVMWNPGTTNYSNAEATTQLYPGDKYVDAIGADVYSDIYPYSDGGTTPTYHDWDTGKEDTSLSQFLADPINRVHYFNDPAATVYNNDSSDGHSLSLANLIQFAQEHGKTFDIPEAGAGNSSGGHDVADDAAFPQWLAQQLTAATKAGQAVGFVSLWDSNGGGNYEFSQASDDKPAEAAAWAQYFGATTPAPSPVSTPAPPITSAPDPMPAPAPAPTPTPPPVLSIGSGPDVLALSVAEDAWQGNAQFTISIDGEQVGGVQTATALRGAGQTQTVDVLGSFGGGDHRVTVNFLNDAYGGSSATDRNLFVNGATIDGAAAPASTLALYSQGPQSFDFAGPAHGTPDTLDLHVSEDAWRGDAQFTVTINGQTVGGTYTATALHSAGATQDFSLSGNWGAGQKTVGISFINDAYGGTSTTDRNLYVDQVTYDGQAATGAPATLLSNGTSNFSTPAGASAITVNLAEDAWKGDAQYSIAVDGQTLVQDATATAQKSLGQSQAVDLQKVLTAGTHDVAVSFLNDAYGGSSSTDRNLYVQGVSVNGAAQPGGSAALYSTGTEHFQITVAKS